MKKSELKKLIQEMVVQETEKISMGKAYRWKEELMQAAQNALTARSETIKTQEEFQDVIDAEIEKLRGDIDQTLDMIARSLYMVPFQAFKSK